MIAKTLKRYVWVLCAFCAFQIPTNSFAQCLVEEAAEAAYNQQLEVIQATAVDVESIFSGPSSCISTELLTQFDLSSLIIDPLGLITGQVTNTITNAIQSAQQQICQAINEKISATVNNVHGTITTYRGTLNNDLQNVLQTGWDFP